MDQSMAALTLKLRRIAAGMRQMDLARRTGLTTTRLSEIERGVRRATALEQRVIEEVLPELAASFKEIREKESPPGNSDGLPVTS
jgi:transcriptional regulator with XRE-family HTH domain